MATITPEIQRLLDDMGVSANSAQGQEIIRQIQERQSQSQEGLSKWGHLLREGYIPRNTWQTQGDETLKEWLEAGLIRPEEQVEVKQKASIPVSLKERYTASGYTGGILSEKAIPTAGENVADAYAERLLPSQILDLLDTATRQAKYMGVELSRGDISALATEGTKGMKPEEVGDYLFNLKTTQEKATTEKAYQTKLPETQQQISKFFTELGIPVDQEAVDYFSDLTAKGQMTPYEVKNFLMQTPAYQEKKSEEVRTAAGIEAKTARTQLSEELSKSSGEFLQQQALPGIERTFKRLGGEGRASAQAAVTGATAEVAKQREAQLAGAGIESAARQEGYVREDYLRQIASQYNDTLRQWQNAKDIWSMNTQAELTKYNYPIQRSSQLANTLYQDRATSERQAYEEKQLNIQRAWQLEDRQYQEDLANKQTFQNILGMGLGYLGGKLFTTGLGAAIGGQKGAIAGLTGAWKQYNKVR